MKWTEKQQEAIDLRKKNILVAAAAGSGKTAVLVERIKNLIIEEGVSVDELLVVTFTNAAASEMREKIVKAVTLALEKEQGDTAFLQKQLNMIHRANISTFHSFALDIIRKNFHKIDIDPGFKICDTSRQIILQEQALDILMEESFEDEEEEFLEFLNCYGTSKNEKNIREMILNLYTYMQSIPNSRDWLEAAIQELNISKENFPSTKLFMEMTSVAIRQMNAGIRHCEHIADMMAEIGAEKLRKKVEQDLQGLKKIKADMEDFFGGKGSYEMVYSALESFEFVRLVAGKDEKDAYADIKEGVDYSRKACKNAIASLSMKLFYLPLEEQLNHMKESHYHGRTLASLVIKFTEIFSSLKREKALVDFNDIEQYAIEILTDEAIAEEYRKKFKYIFIDEYQDSNMVQEELISRIKRENNLFMVGDVKQSIYKFRQADPELFMGKYQKYSRGEDENSTKLDLNFNFRSKGKVIDGVNAVFSEIMDDYDEAAALHRGIDYVGEADYGVELHIMDREQEEDLDEEIKELSAAEREAYIIGKIIKDALGTTIYDVKKGVEREISKRDIVILLRGQKNYGEKIRNTLLSMDIPSHVNDSDGYFDTLEIDIFMNFLRVIDNMKNDIPLISVLHSEIFGFSPEDLSKIRIAQGAEKCSFCDAFLRYEEAEIKEDTEVMNSELQERVRGAVHEIYKWRSYVNSLTLDRLIWKILVDTGYYTFAGALPGGRQRQANLRALVDKAVSFQNLQMQGLYGFINYVDTIKSRKVSTGQVTLVGENDDVVRIMTIHKSKGLEYPFVIVAGLGRRFNTTKGGRLSMHKRIGIGLNYVDTELKYHRRTLQQKIIDESIKKEEMEEELRVLYVAFTRAQDKLILIGSYSHGKMEYISEVPDMMDVTCYLDMLIPVAKSKKLPLIMHKSVEISGPDASEIEARMNMKLLIASDERNKKSEDVFERISAGLSYEYPYKDARKFKSKFSVSLLNRMENMVDLENAKTEQYEDFYYENLRKKSLRKPGFMGERKEPLSSSQKGILLHKLLEYWDYKEAGMILEAQGDESLRMYGTSIVDGLAGKNLIDEDERDYLLKNLRKVENLQKSDFGRRVSKAEKVYKEEPFTLMKELKGEDILIQGIIDCYFEENGEYVIADYKSSYLQADNGEASEVLSERYGRQLKLYAEGLEASKNKHVKAAYIVLINSGEVIQVI